MAMPMLRETERLASGQEPALIRVRQRDDLEVGVVEVAQRLKGALERFGAVEGVDDDRGRERHGFI
jgi:hypothetical protein